MITRYANSIGVSEADARTARNIHLSVADCKHLVKVLRRHDGKGFPLALLDTDTEQQSIDWSQALADYLGSAV